MKELLKGSTTDPHGLKGKELVSYRCCLCESAAPL